MRLRTSLTVLLLAGCAEPALAQAPAESAGGGSPATSDAPRAPRELVEKSFTVRGFERRAWVALPDAAENADGADGKPQAAHPVVLLFHGHGGHPEHLSRHAFHEFWPEAVFVYPQGLRTKTPYDPDGRYTGWQHQRGDYEDRDLAFVDVILEDLRAELPIDERRIYATGHSNGAVFTYLLWEARGETFAALAPSAGGPVGMRSLRREWPRLPILHLYGERDAVVSAELQRIVIRALKIYNDCAAEGTPWPGAAAVSEVPDGAAAVSEDPDGVAGFTGLQYASPHGTPVVELHHRGGHQFPRGAAKLIVRFFRAHARQGTPASEDEDLAAPAEATAD